MRGILKKALKWAVFFAAVIFIPGGVALAVRKIRQRSGPGAALLVVSALVLAGCAHFRARTDGFVMEGRTSSPESVMIAQAQADAIQAQAYATRRCAEDSRRCGAVWGPWGAMYGAMDTTQGGEWAPVGATPPMPSQTTPAAQNIAKQLDRIETNTIQLKESQRLLIQASRTKKGKQP